MKKIRRETTWRAYWMGWCPNCGETILTKNLVPSESGLKGLNTYGCKKCNSEFFINTLEGRNDLLEVPVNYKFPTLIQYKQWEKKVNE